MPNPDTGLVASLTAGVSARLRDVVGNAAILGGVALLALTGWVVCIAGLVAALAPLWGIPLAMFAVALLLGLVALVLLAVLDRRTRQQQARAALRQAETRRKAQAALRDALPGVVQNQPGALLVGAGLLIGALLIAALRTGVTEQTDRP